MSSQDPCSLPSFHPSSETYQRRFFLHPLLKKEAIFKRFFRVLLRFRSRKHVGVPISIWRRSNMNWNMNWTRTCTLLDCTTTIAIIIPCVPVCRTWNKSLSLVREGHGRILCRGLEYKIFRSWTPLSKAIYATNKSEREITAPSLFSLSVAEPFD